MADVFDAGGGGGRSGERTSDISISDKPYELVGLTQESIQQINDMFEQLYKASQRQNAVISQLLASTSDIRRTVVQFKKEAIIAANINTGSGALLVPAQGPRKVIVPIMGAMEFAIVTGFNFSPLWTVNYKGLGGFGSAPNLMSFGAPVQTAAAHILRQSANIIDGAAISSNLALYANNDLVLTGNTSPLTGGADTVYTVTLCYTVLDLGGG